MCQVKVDYQIRIVYISDINAFELTVGGAKRKTVLVFIHASGPYGGVTKDVTLAPDFLLSHDNIVVHVAYRVQMLGFLNLGFGEYTGNMALKDQQLGLKWVYENIENFAGNKDQITIFGASLGEFSPKNFYGTNFLKIALKLSHRRCICSCPNS